MIDQITTKRNAFFATLLAIVVLCTAGAPASAQGDRLERKFYKSGREVLRTFRPVVAQASYATVSVYVQGSKKSLATVIDKEGYAIGKASEIMAGYTDKLDEIEVTVRTRSGREYPTHIINADIESDLALLRIDAQDEELDVVKWAEGVVDIGQWAITAGNRVDPVAVGVVSVKERQINKKRALIGVLLGEDDNKGVKVERVLDGMGAAEAGIQAGDIVTHVDGEPVKGREDMIKRIGDFSAGESVKVRVTRGGKELDLEIKLMVPPPNPFDRGAIQNRLGGPLSERNHDFARVFQHDTVIKPSDCGSPVVNLDGEVIGINIARAGRVASYALPAPYVLERIETLRGVKHEAVKAEEKVEEKAE